MFCAQLQAAIDAAPRHQLAHVSGLLWKAYAAGTVTEAEAERLSSVIEVRKAAPRPAEAPGRAQTGSRPRTPASGARRREWAGDGLVPRLVRHHFTQGEIAVLTVVAREVQRRGDCRLAIDHIAAAAGCCRALVKRALRAAEVLGMLRITERRITGFRNDTNIVEIVCTTWRAWLGLRRAGGGVTLVARTEKLRKEMRHSSLERGNSAAEIRQPMRQGQGVDRNSGQLWPKTGTWYPKHNCISP